VDVDNDALAKAESYTVDSTSSREYYIALRVP
jgi:hypothetical protein